MENRKLSANKYVVIDTNVFMSLNYIDEEQHENAKKLLNIFIKNGLKAVIPKTALIEAYCIYKRKQLEKKNIIQNQQQFSFKSINIDNKFIEKYCSDTTIPYTKAGDFYFMAIAKYENIPLITEDNKLLKAASKAGIKVFKIKEYLNSISN